MEKLTRRWFYAFIMTLLIVTMPIGLPLLVYYTVRVRFARWRHPEYARPALQPKQNA